MHWTVEQRSIKSLTVNPRNPRRMTKDQAEHLKESISKFGMCEPIVINTDGTVIGGHQRLSTLKKLGHKKVDVYIPETTLSDEEASELNIRLNRNTGEWDFDVLANNWDSSDLIRWGFTPQELHMDLIDSEDPKEKSDHRKASMHITFADEIQLQEAENRISVIIDEFPGASYKKKV
jgi:ParB-like chromosome segregation protein Spo0J